MTVELMMTTMGLVEGIIDMIEIEGLRVDMTLKVVK